jgi:hypothetical protein
VPSPTIRRVLRHVVLLHLVPDRAAGAVDAIVEALRALPARIPELRSYEVAVDAGLDGSNADIVVLATFDDEAGFVAYRDHPQHRAVIEEHLRPVLASRSALQHHLSPAADHTH